MVLVDDPAMPQPPLHDRFRALSGLTSAEASLAVGLMQGLSPEDIAERRNVRLTTVRTQIRAILDKLGHRRLTDALIDLSHTATLGPKECQAIRRRS